MPKKATLTPEQRYANRRACQEDYRHRVHRFTLQFSLQDTEAYEWFASHPDQGKYLKSLILADKQKQLMLSSETNYESEVTDTMVDYNELLYEKVQAEYDAFIEELKRMTPEQVIDRAYEKVTKENMVTIIQEKELTPSEAKALYREKYPLDRMYQEWLDTDVSEMQMFKDSIDDTAKDAVKEMKAKQRESR